MNKRNVILIDLTDRCTLDCSYCFTSDTKSDITDKTIDDTVKYVERLTKNSNDFYALCFSGGEPGLLDPNRVLSLIRRIKSLNINAEYILNTNLVYSVTDQWLDVFRQVDSISTTYDYDVRFKTPTQRALFFKNLRLAVSVNDRVNLTVILTKSLIESYTPQSMVDLILATAVKSCEFYRVFLTQRCNDTSPLRPSNAAMNQWLYQVYKLFLKYRRHFDCETFKSIEDAVRGEGCYEYTKYCVVNNRYIDVHGNINQCPAGTSQPYANVADPHATQHIPIIRIEQERRLKQQCQSCSIVQYCNGGCYNWIWDETGCPVPKRIFELALLNAEK